MHRSDVHAQQSPAATLPLRPITQAHLALAKCNDNLTGCADSIFGGARGRQRGGKKAGAKKAKPQRPGVRGAKGGKLRPGEKAQLQRERMQAVRAALAAKRGFDADRVNAELVEFVEGWRRLACACRSYVQSVIR